jgi:hypothetical protein
MRLASLMGDGKHERAVVDNLIHDGVRETASRYGANVAGPWVAEIRVCADHPNEALDFV